MSSKVAMGNKGGVKSTNERGVSSNGLMVSFLWHAITGIVLAYIVLSAYYLLLGHKVVHSTVVITGMSGVGKSTLSNNLLQKKAFEVCGDPAACTRDHGSQTAYIVVERYFGVIPTKYLHLTVVDTIGFSDARSHQNDAKTTESLKQFLSKQKNKSFVYLLSDGRVKAVDIQLMESIKQQLVEADDRVMFAINRLGPNPEDVAQLKGKLISEWDHVQSESTVRPKIVLLHEAWWNSDRVKNGVLYNTEDMNEIYKWLYTPPLPKTLR